MGIIFEKKNNIAYITLNNPEKVNAITTKMVRELREVLNIVRNDDDIRGMVLTGAGRGFCSGADTEMLMRLATHSRTAGASEMKLTREQVGKAMTEDKWLGLRSRLLSAEGYQNLTSGEARDICQMVKDLREANQQMREALNELNAIPEHLSMDAWAIVHDVWLKNRDDE